MDATAYDKAFSFAGRTVLVTGAAGQLGTEIRRAFSALDATVVGWDVQPSPDNAVVDITDATAVETSMATLFRAPDRVDILINNAGVSCFEPFLERPEASFDAVMEVNLKGTFHCIRAFARHAAAPDSDGSIVNIGSVYGLISPDPRIYTDCARQNSEVYGASKAGIIQMTRYFAVHLAPSGIRVNCVSPGGIANPDVGQGPDFVKKYSARTPMGRLARCEEIIGGILYFASPLSSYTTGQNLAIDGGLTCW